MLKVKETIACLPLQQTLLLITVGLVACGGNSESVSTVGFGQELTLLPISDASSINAVQFLVFDSQEDRSASTLPSSPVTRPTPGVDGLSPGGCRDRLSTVCLFSNLEANSHH